MNSKFSYMNHVLLFEVVITQYRRSDIAGWRCLLKTNWKFHQWNMNVMTSAGICTDKYEISYINIVFVLYSLIVGISLENMAKLLQSVRLNCAIVESKSFGIWKCKILCGCFGNMCRCIYCLYCVFVLVRLCVFFLFVLSVWKDYCQRVKTQFQY
jgi:hypothetical protein